MKHLADFLFANEAEIMALYEVETFEEAVAAVRAECETVALTRSEKGSVVMRGGEIVSVAAGFLSGLATGRELAACGALGSLAAAEVISHWGPRPEVSLAALAAERGL